MPYVWLWLQTGFQLVIGFIEHLQIATTCKDCALTVQHTAYINRGHTRSTQSVMFSPVSSTYSLTGWKVSYDRSWAELTGFQLPNSTQLHFNNWMMVTTTTTTPSTLHPLTNYNSHDYDYWLLEFSVHLNPFSCLCHISVVGCDHREQCNKTHRWFHLRNSYLCLARWRKNRKTHRTVKISTFRNVTQCSPLKGSHHFRGTYCCYLQDQACSICLVGLFFDPQEGGEMSLQDVSCLPTDHIVLGPRGHNSL